MEEEFALFLSEEKRNVSIHSGDKIRNGDDGDKESRVIKAGRTYNEGLASEYAETCPELTRLDLLIPSSNLRGSFSASCELTLLVDRAADNIDRRLWREGTPLTMGLSKGRQAPTIPSEDSTIGQYIVGVKRSWLQCQSLSEGVERVKAYLQVKSRSLPVVLSNEQLALRMGQSMAMNKLPFAI